jgi:hypothetical protein
LTPDTARFFRRAPALWLVLVAACAGQSVAVRKLESGARPPPGGVKYDRSATAIQQGAFDDVAGRADATAAERELAAALRDIEMGRSDAAERALARLASTVSDPVREQAAAARCWLLVGRARWADLLRLSPDPQLAAFASEWARAAPERVTFTAPSATLPATLEGVDCPFVDVRVGDRPYRFLLDTGATFTLVTADVAEAAGIRPADAQADAGTSTSRLLAVRPAVIPRLSVGNAVFENHPCLVADASDLKLKFLLFSLLSIDGVVGWNAIRHLDVEVDFRVPEVTIREPRPRSVERNLFWLCTPIVRAALADGLPILAKVDTGASESSLLGPFFESFPQGYREEAAGRAREGSTRIWGAGGSERMRTTTVERLSVVLADRLLEFRNLRSGGTARNPIFRPVVQFGNDIALKGTMRIDFANGALELGP